MPAKENKSLTAKSAGDAKGFLRGFAGFAVKLLSYQSVVPKLSLNR